MTRKPSVPERLRRQVQERAQGRCEYCLIHESDMYYPHEADHVIAEKHGGPTSLENLAWSCFYCNRFKGSDLASIDPTSQKVWQRLNQLCEWNVRQFTRLWNLEMRKMEAECPNTFYLIPGSP